jgi:hypothetical protein
LKRIFWAVILVLQTALESPSETVALPSRFVSRKIGRALIRRQYFAALIRSEVRSAEKFLEPLDEDSAFLPTYLNIIFIARAFERNQANCASRGRPLRANLSSDAEWEATRPIVCRTV